MFLSRASITAAVLASTLGGCGVQQAGMPSFQTSAQGRTQALAVPNQLIVKYKGTRSTRLVDMAKVLRDDTALQTVLLSPLAGRTVDQLATDLAKDPTVEWVDQNWIVTVPSPVADKRAPLQAPGIAFETNDPLAKQQWHLPKINVAQAWQTSQGEGIIVAVVDTGIDTRHPDLVANLVPGFNSLDNTNDPTDDNGHGTHVAGIIGAVAGNGIGMAGVSPKAKIMPIRALGDQGGSAQSVSAGIQYAVDHGASVINLSLGSTKPSKAIESAIKYALKKGVSVVAAMGNSGDQGNPRQWPASYAGVVAVGATDPQDKITPWSDFGEWIAVSAPGYGIWSTFPTYETSLTRLAKQNPGALPPEAKIQTNYSALSGTSQATPVVAGIIANMRSVQKGLTRAQIRDQIMKSSRDVGPAGFDAHYGAGLVDAAAAVGGRI